MSERSKKLNREIRQIRERGGAEIVGLLDCWIVGLLDCWIVGLLDERGSGVNVHPG